ncbi:MAG: hypothetical protein M0Z58_06765 [Nitrospiraceae bacterium]|nr:hypothetical protein [Nitrospiraceae bacterium]
MIQTGSLYNCLCPACGSIWPAYLEDEKDAASRVCPGCGSSGLKALPKDVFGT